VLLAFEFELHRPVQRRPGCFSSLSQVVGHAGILAAEY
jgi:hypothetical protein